MSEPQRYASERPFPGYAYLPGRDPHPTQDERGHSFTRTGEPPPQYYPPERWSENSDYLYGVDLYNFGYLWEAHEAWEGLWHQAKHDPHQAQMLQGLIQCTAAALKIPMGQPNGLARLSEFGTGRLESVAREHGTYMGLSLMEFVREFREFAESAPDSADERPRIVLDD